MKVCTKCKIEKELGEFYNESRVKDGKKAECKYCLNNRQKLRREEINIWRRKHRKNSSKGNK